MVLRALFFFPAKMTSEQLKSLNEHRTASRQRGNNWLHRMGISRRTDYFLSGDGWAERRVVLIVSGLGAIVLAMSMSK